MDKRLKQIIIALAVLGLLVSIYMTIYKYTGADDMCLGSGDCHTVNFSKYAEVNGIPVALIGVFGYASMLGILLFSNKNEFLEENEVMIIFGISLIGFLFTLWLVYVEVALLQAYCPFCITSQITMTVIFILSVVRLIRQS
jgi:uncharacterized membrane protein